jgi:hypothetical protein
MLAVALRLAVLFRFVGSIVSWRLCKVPLVMPYSL